MIVNNAIISPSFLPFLNSYWIRGAIEFMMHAIFKKCFITWEFQLHDSNSGQTHSFSVVLLMMIHSVGLFLLLAIFCAVPVAPKNDSDWAAFFALDISSDFEKGKLPHSLPIYSLTFISLISFLYPPCIDQLMIVWPSIQFLSTSNVWWSVIKQ